jgi:Kef-type K+ transport system membrane component KefB
MGGGRRNGDPTVSRIWLCLVSLSTLQSKTAQALFLGVALAVTAVPAVIKVFIDLRRLQENYSKVIVSAAVIDDVLSLLLLAFLTAFIEAGAMPGWQQLLMLAAKVAAFFAITVAMGRYLFPWIARLVIHRSYLEESEFSILIVVSLAFSVLAELMDMHFILGAFIAGLFFAKRRIPHEVFHDVQNKVKGITTGFLAPIFFSSIGLSLNLSSLVNIPLIVWSLIATASVGKILGAGVPARLIGFSWKESMVIGNGMNARGAVELIIADIALRAGLFNHPARNEVIGNIFSAVVIMAIVTTVTTPIVVKWILERNGEETNGQII